MSHIADDLRQIIESATERLQAIPESRSHASHIDGQWSAKTSKILEEDQAQVIVIQSVR